MTSSSHQPDLFFVCLDKPNLVEKIEKKPANLFNDSDYNLDFIDLWEVEV